MPKPCVRQNLFRFRLANPRYEGDPVAGAAATARRIRVCSAIGVCGFVDPIEARDVIAIVLDAIEMPDPIPEEAASEGPGIALSDA